MARKKTKKTPSSRGRRKAAPKRTASRSKARSKPARRKSARTRKRAGTTRAKTSRSKASRSKPSRSKKSRAGASRSKPRGASTAARIRRRGSAPARSGPRRPRPERPVASGRRAGPGAKTGIAIGEAIDARGLGPEAAGQSGDTEGLSRAELADSESVEELVEEGQAFEAGIVSGVENAPDADEGEIRTREVPEDDVPQEYLDED